ncbi:MAG: GNAT family N-acetyltransferase [Bacteroidales bacterium]|jgi:ribosomal protein S18 acetylase RimI-like enzyme|nr:GNAT family N-acetyltransferase [Bacteroidales bacterium]
MRNYQKLVAEDFDSFFELMEKVFPPVERRSKEDASQIFTTVPCYHAMGLKKDGKVTAFIAYWLFEDICFVDHLAVDDSLRGQGIGSEIMRYLVENTASTVVLEVEPPEDEISRKRIRFYEKIGFHLNTFSYIQPSMQPGQPEIPLMIMSYPHGLDLPKFNAARKRIFDNCYNVKTDSEDA